MFLTYSFPILYQSFVSCPVLLLLDPHTDFAEQGKVAWYSFLNNFPTDFYDPHSHFFSIVSDRCFVEFSCFSMIQRMLIIWSPGSHLSNQLEHLEVLCSNILLKHLEEFWALPLPLTCEIGNCMVVWAFFNLTLFWNCIRLNLFPILLSKLIFQMLDPTCQLRLSKPNK